jgi:hypothetical protein
MEISPSITDALYHQNPERISKTESKENSINLYAQTVDFIPSYLDNGGEIHGEPPCVPSIPNTSKIPTPVPKESLASMHTAHLQIQRSLYVAPSSYMETLAQSRTDMKTSFSGKAAMKENFGVRDWNAEVQYFAVAIISKITLTNYNHL